ncbi:hypothetical protein N7497_012135 [Penicillium chrysogenum]|nr:hypothetical protein N7497_012135 [Penicillium chrysogenum]
MDLANLFSSTAAKLLQTPVDSSYSKRSASHLPPPEEPKVSLPSISYLLGADSQLKRQRLPPSLTSLGERHVRVQSCELPPTPPLGPGYGHGHSHASPESLTERLHRS